MVGCLSRTVGWQVKCSPNCDPHSGGRRGGTIVAKPLDDVLLRRETIERTAEIELPKLGRRRVRMVAEPLSMGAADPEVVIAIESMDVRNGVRKD